MMRNMVIGCCLFLSIVSYPLNRTAFSQEQGEEYVIGVDDVLSVTFWQLPELNTTTKVGSDGKIELPIIGRITAAGLTPSRLGEKIVAQISLYNRAITQATVQVTEYASKYVFVMGEVQQPGKYTFETIPNLWQIILEAGGPTPNAKLTQVTILRGAGSPEEGEIVNVDLTGALRRGDLSLLPPVYPRDMIRVPAVGEKAIGAALEKDVIYIFGAVGTQGAIPYEPSADLMETIITAGGPSGNAKLEDVRVISRDSRAGTLVRVDLNKYTSRANPVPVYLKPGDVVYVPAQKPRSELSRVLIRNLTGIAVSTVTSLILFRLF